MMCRAYCAGMIKEPKRRPNTIIATAINIKQKIFKSGMLFLMPPWPDVKWGFSSNTAIIISINNAGTIQNCLVVLWVAVSNHTPAPERNMHTGVKNADVNGVVAYEPEIENC